MLAIDKSAQTDRVRKLSILFVEDDAEVRESMARYLRRRVDRVHTAQSGEEGLDSFKTQRPDLLISDIRMGGMDGLAMCRAIRETDPDLPVIFISAHNESEILLSSIDLGVTKFIVKPVDTNVLMDTIGDVADKLEEQCNLKDRMQQMDLVADEADYEDESVKSYLSNYLESGHHDELGSVRHLNIPKLKVSGDFYSVVKHHDDLYVMLADGAGHGLSAVIPALQIPKIFQHQAGRGFSLQTIAAEINRALYEQHIRGHFVATTLIRINPGEHLIEVLNCSNPPALVFDDDGMLLHSCPSTSTALGMVGGDEFSPEVARFSMDRNARIYLFTDGLPDTLQVCEPDSEDDKVKAMFGHAFSAGVFDAVAEKISHAARHCKVDDITLLEVRFDCEDVAARQIEMPLEAGASCEPEMPVALNEMTLLYVEDDDLTRDYLVRYLNRRLGRVYLAKDGREGLALFAEHRPQIVLSDIKMPNMDGLQMAEEIRKLDQEVPIIVTSGSDNAEDAERMFEMGISRFHMKPLAPEKLLNSIRTCVLKSRLLNHLRFSASAFQSSSLAVVTTDHDKRIVGVNPAFSRITGYTLDEVFGHSPMLLSSGEHVADVYQAMWRTLDESGSWSGEMLCHHKNGETVSEWLTVNAINGEDGAASGYHLIFSDIAEREMQKERALQLSLHDSLTQLPNRAMFADITDKMLLKARREMGSLALLTVKIERFIDINNLFGVHMGDEVLLSFVQRLLQHVDASDVVCRTGGVEFAVLIQEVGGREHIEQVVAELFAVMEQPIELKGRQIPLHMSVGVSLYPSGGETYEELVKSASSARDEAHQAGGGGYRFFDPMVSQRKEREATLKHGIKGGIQRNEFYMLYQPKYSLSQQRVVGAEALVRWQHPVSGLVSPVEFIPLAENSGDVIELTEWIMDAVCAQLAVWRQQGLPQVPVSINISPVHFWRGDLVGSLQSALQKWGVTPAMLTIEVTEGVVMDASDRTLQVLAELKALGFHLSIDDFGTGYSSLKYLKDMPVSELKIDRSFVIEIPEGDQPNDLSRTAIPRAIIQLASEFNLSVVAEGVETENQKNFLLENGCDVIQGYLFSKPISAENFAALLS